MTNVKQHVPIFISSTFTDLNPYRDAVIDTLDKLKVGVNGMELFGARSEKPLETCLEEVSKCQVFIGILAMRYGSIDEKTGKSYTHLEYETASKEKLNILIYLVDEDNARLPPKFVDVSESAKKLRDFKDFLQKEHTVDFFLSPEDLAHKVERDLLRLFTEKGLVIEKEKLQPSVKPEITCELLQKFDLMPKQYAGNEIELIAEFSGPSNSVPQNICNAIRLPLGHSISRPITILQPLDLSNQFNFLNKLYAAYEGCNFIYDAKVDEEFKISAKLAFGQKENINLQSANNQSGIITLHTSNTIKDLETGEVIRDYITRSPIKAIIFVKQIS